MSERNTVKGDILLRIAPKLKNDRAVCSKGHPMTTENTVYKMGIRSCRACASERRKEARERFIKATGG